MQTSKLFKILISTSNLVTSKLTCELPTVKLWGYLPHYIKGDKGGKNYLVFVTLKNSGTSPL